MKLKRILALIFCLLMAFSVTATALAEDDGGSDAPAAADTNYMGQMVQAATVGDAATGEAAQAARDAKIDALGLEGQYPKISYGDLYLLAKTIQWEAGSYWLSDQWKMCVGEVILNRAASPEFPNTISAVVYQRGQYAGVTGSRFARTQPDARSVGLALRLLEGERVLNDPSVVFQANFPQGGGVHTALYDSKLGWTYFCFSSRPNLYHA